MQTHNLELFHVSRCDYTAPISHTGGLDSLPGLIFLQMCRSLDKTPCIKLGVNADWKTAARSPSPEQSITEPVMDGLPVGLRGSGQQNIWSRPRLLRYHTERVEADLLDQLVALLQLQGSVLQRGGGSVLDLQPLLVRRLTDIRHGEAQRAQPWKKKKKRDFSLYILCYRSTIEYC